MKNYFRGWYFKCQSNQDIIAFIVASHRNTCSIQLITTKETWNIDFDELIKRKGDFYITIDNNIFSDQGIEININRPNLLIRGTLTYSNLSPLKYNIMGPFQYIPFMQCKHSVISMKHTINGNLTINNQDYVFKDGVGYIEGDRGYSFPQQYAWTQCFFRNGSLMLSVADIPFGLFHFTGIIGVILIDNKEYRLATYLGAKVIKKQDQEIIIKQKDMIFKAKLINRRALPLLAPTSGKMIRTIHESVMCQAAYSFTKGSQTILSFETIEAAFEYEYE